MKETIDKCINTSKRIQNMSKLSFAIGSMLAGAYVGLGIILIFSIGNLLDPAIRTAVMGMTFGIALTLVLIAGAELFTGHVMFHTFNILHKGLSVVNAIRMLLYVWIFNLIGCIILAIVYYYGSFNLLESDSLIHTAAVTKTQMGASTLFARGILCNWLVCLAIWMGLKVEGSAKILVVWWCLLAFISSGYEHSIANMTLFAISYLGEHPESLTLLSIGHNLLWVSLGNIVSGVLFMGVGYTFYKVGYET